MKFVDELDLTGRKIINLSDPTSAQDAATRAYVLARVAEVTGFTEAEVEGIITAFVDAAFINALTIDADTLGGDSKATIISNVIASIVDSAPGTLDTLNEFAAALGDDASFAASTATALALRVQRYAVTIGDTVTTTFTITHNLGSKDVTVQIYESGDDFEQVWATVKRATTNTVTVTFASAPTTNQYRVVVMGMA